MKKNTKIILFSLLGLMILGAILAVLVMTEPLSEQPSVENITETISLINRDLNEVESAEITNATGNYIIKSSGGAYYIENLDQDIKTNQAEFTKNLGYLALLPAEELVEETDDLLKYGLDSPRAKITVNFNDKSGYILNIGDDAPIESKTYISINKEKKVYTIQSFKVAPFMLDQFSYVEKLLFPAYEPQSGKEIERVEITGSDGKAIVIEPNQNGSFTMTKPQKLMISYEKSEDYIYGLLGLEADRAVGTFKLNWEHKVTVRYNNEEYTLFIGKETNDGYYASANTFPGMVFVIGAEKLPWIGVTPETLMSNLFLMPYIHDLSQYVIETDGKTITVTVSGDAESEEFLLDGNVIEPSRAKDMYQYMISAFAESIYKENPEGLPLARFIYRYKDSAKPDDIVEFYGSNDRSLIIKVNGETSYKCRENFFKRLVQNINAFESGEKIITSW
ncbi:MAG: DUF4340 domain-containing protein [Eubacterium sp.]|jgi:hypothetical protein|nr:DUF4340 domain-containing protein [Eubacterium sp.]